MILSMLIVSSLANSQINLNQERINQENVQQENGSSHKQISENNADKNLSAENKEQAKFSNMSSLLLLNAAMVGYGKACKLNNNSINEINDFFIERYRLKNDSFILEQYNAKINEFATTNPKKDECNIFEKEFNIVLQKVVEAKKN